MFLFGDHILVPQLASGMDRLGGESKILKHADMWVIFETFSCRTIDFLLRFKVRCEFSLDFLFNITMSL